MNLDLAGKRALVTGGSRGIGRAISLALAHQGVEVAVCYRNDSDAVESLRGELAGAGSNNLVLKADLADQSDVTELVSVVQGRYGAVDILVHNAGVVSHKTIADLDLEEWRRILDTNLTALFLVTQGLVDAMPAGGSIIIIGSAVATRGMAGRTHYGASKAGAIGFMRALCKEVGPRGIRVNLLAPGIIETDQVSGLTEEGRARYSALAALSRLGRPDEIAGAALFLASDLSSFVSGVTLNVDGGI